MGNMTHPSSSRRTLRGHACKRTQHGLALITVLLFLLAITGVVVWSARQSMMGEGAARNQLDIEVAREAAEAALRDAERDIANAKAPTFLTNAACARDERIAPKLFTASCEKGLCIRADPSYAQSNWAAASAGSNVFSEPWWSPEKGGQWNNDLTAKPTRSSDGAASGKCGAFVGAVPLGVYTGATPIRGVARQPEYIIEYFARPSQVSKQSAAVYRITARGFGYHLRTQVVLQTYFVPLR